MPQFDVFINPGVKRRDIPFVVALQNTRFNRAPTRLVAPLIATVRINIGRSHLAPSFIVTGQSVMLDVFGLTTIYRTRLGEAIASLADEDSRGKLVRAMDELLSQA